MSTENQRLLRRLLNEGVGNNDASVIDELVATDYVNHDAPIPVRGPDGFKQLAGMFGAAFPDIRITIQDEFADGDRVGTRGAVTGTHQGEFMGIPPTGKPVNVKYLDLWRVEDGKFVENWVQMDMLGLLQQLGVVPPPGG
jgi:predicted ester cyclase